MCTETETATAERLQQATDPEEGREEGTWQAARDRFFQDHQRTLGRTLQRQSLPR